MESKKKGIKADFIKLSSIKNSKVLFLIKNKIYKILNEIKKDKKKVKILILGVGYKKNIDDIRESASISLAKLLAKNFKNISFSDPHVKNIKEKSFTNKKSLNLSSKTLKSHDIVILMTDHDKFNYPMIYKNSKKIIDCRGRYSLNEKVMRA